ncbi:hypothetical protein F6R98_05580 [Candidatus Methylospira mobilis]|uniref:Uncharacterized protein n=1 Tax=Candidatus Methylospira mobilis TaxID=1808979 RepID=A0A5Q0BF81_9GAMM|nr:hypothetical protein [Candidatus Methylospira mobilis]QFY42169.1 hypothetical protein F6R98_05580 [Candidatus Methylospira mobilis]WNV03183.1 hypothetical protein RP726_11955 [Candidatus Methylospira mobilis]
MRVEDLINQFIWHFMLGLLLGGIIAYMHHRIGRARLRRMIRKLMRRNGSGVFVRPYTKAGING